MLETLSDDDYVNVVSVSIHSNDLDAITRRNNVVVGNNLLSECGIGQIALWAKCIMLVSVSGLVAEGLCVLGRCLVAWHV